MFSFRVNRISAFHTGLPAGRANERWVPGERRVAPLVQGIFIPPPAWLKIGQGERGVATAIQVKRKHHLEGLTHIRGKDPWT